MIEIDRNMLEKYKFNINAFVGFIVWIIKTDLQVVGWGAINGIDLAQDKDRWPEKSGGFLRFQILQPAQMIRHVTMRTSLIVECSVHCACVTLCAVSHVTSPRGFLMYSACNPKDKYDTSECFFSSI